MSSLHRFSRNELLIGVDGQRLLANASVAVIGLGGVGSYAAEALCRAGIGRMIIVDFDDICLTNINRQLHALENTVGKPKVQVVADRLGLINPSCKVVPFREFYSAESSDLLLSGGIDYMIDAIDHFTSKVHLIKSCFARDIPIISSMGAANKLDPSKIQVSDISETRICRMARSLRKLLKGEGITRGVKVAFSTEEFRALSGESSGCKDDCVCPNRGSQQFTCKHRRVVLGSISYVPAIFGLTMAGVVVNDLLNAAAENLLPRLTDS